MMGFEADTHERRVRIPKATRGNINVVINLVQVGAVTV